MICRTPSTAFLNSALMLTRLFQTFTQMTVTPLQFKRMWSKPMRAQNVPAVFFSFRLLHQYRLWHVAHFRYLGTTVIIQNWIQEEIKRTLKSGNACCHSVQNFCLLVCCLKSQKLEYAKLQFCMWFCMGAKLGL
jgi:hypothetical protein